MACVFSEVRVQACNNREPVQVGAVGLYPHCCF